MFSVAEYEAIELAADRLTATTADTGNNVTHILTPLTGIDPKSNFGMRKDVMHPSVGLKSNNPGIGAHRNLRHPSVVATTAHLDLSKHTSLTTLCALAKEYILEETHLDFYMRAASMTAGEETEASDKAE